MEQLKEIGIDLDKLSLPKEDNLLLLADFKSQAKTSAEAAYGAYWSDNIKRAMKDSKIYELMARSVWESGATLGIEEYPKLGLLHGFSIGKLNYYGYCWEDDSGKVWVGLDENWFGDMAGSIHYSGGLSLGSKNLVKFVLAEEVFHSYIRQVRPDLAEENIKANISKDKSDYWNSLGEQAAKGFANWYVAASSAR